MNHLALEVYVHVIWQFLSRLAREEEVAFGFNIFHVCIAQLGSWGEASIWKSSFISFVSLGALMKELLQEKAQLPLDIFRGTLSPCKGWLFGIICPLYPSIRSWKGKNVYLSDFHIHLLERTLSRC